MGGRKKILPTVIDRIRERAPEFGSNPAVIEGEQSWTHAQLCDRVDRLSQALLKLGLDKGEVVMAWLPNAHEAIEAELASLQIGAIWVSINTRLTEREAAEIIADCGPKFLIADQERVAKFHSHSPIPYHSPRLIHTREPASEAPRDALIYESLLASSPAERPRVEIQPEDIARLRYTSGTTGKPKAAVLPHRVYLASLKNLQTELHPLGPTDRVLHSAPLTHASGAMVFPILAAGGANVLIQHFDAEEICEIIERLRITTMFLVPTILHRLSAAEGFNSRDLSSLKTIMYGGAPMPVEKLPPIIKRIGPALVHIYGMTEAPYPISTLQRADHRIGNPKLGSIGKPATICRMKILDESGRELGAGETGEIWISGENVMRGYWKDDEETKKILKDGWLATGDLGKRDADGYYWIVDRKKDVIISGGFNVYAKEVESVLCAHENVAEAAAVGLPHADWGETVIAFVVPRSDASLDAHEIQQWCHERLSGYKCPKRIEIVGELPKTSSGKVIKRDLVQTASANAKSATE